MAMTSAQRKTLDRTLEVLAEDLDVTPAIIHLKSKDILKDIDEEKISAKVTEKEKVMELVKIIKKRGKKAFQALKEYLEDCSGSEHLAEEMEENLKIVEAELAGLTLQKDGRRQIEKWKEFEGKFHYVKCRHESIGLYQYVPAEINVLLIGKTGSGKSATGNTIIGKDHFKASGTSASVTKTIDMKYFQEDRFNITVIDTPGLFDTAKDFRNEDMLLEIAKTMINFKGGIHLFLLVCSSTRFTAEEQETVAVIEKILSKNVYKNCVVVLTYAQAQYGAKGKYSLREHITNEVQRGGNFAELIKRVKNRVVAVENFFDEDFLREKHRQGLLCYLAQVIQENKGSVYSNKAFEYARVRVEKQDELRKQRIRREGELTTMRSQVRNFLVQKYLNDLTVKQLDNIYGHFKTDVLYIMTRSFVNQLPCITNDDVKEYLKDFIEENGVLIAKVKDMKIQEEKQRKEYEKRRQQLKEKENFNKMQHIVLPLVSNYLKQLSKEDLEELIQRRVLPDEVMNRIKESLASSHVELEDKHICNYIKETFFQNPTEIRKYIDAKILAESLEEQSYQLKELQRAQKVNATMETLKTKLPESLNNKTDDELRELSNDLGNVETGGVTEWEQLFDELIGSEIANTDITLGEISDMYLKQNANLLESIMSTILEKRQKQKEAKERQIREVLRNTALSKISEVIQEKLKSYLTGKSTSELQTLDSNISIGVVPDDIFDKVCGELTRAQKQSLSKNEIDKEIISQIKSQNEIIEECKREAKCFSGSSKVLIKGRGISKISNVKVDDEILVFDEKGVCFFDKIYLISHARDEENITFIHLKTFSGKELCISPGHLIPVGSLYRNVAAKDLAIGDVIFTLQNGIMTSDSVTSISYELCRGAYCPITMNGTIVVNDVAASCYTTFIPSRVAHVLLSPIRVLFSYLPLSLFDKLLPYDDVEGMPVFLLKCRSIVTAWRSLVDRFRF